MERGALVVVLGLGKSGIAATELLLWADAQPVLFDDDPKKLTAESVRELVAQGARVAQGDPLRNASRLVVSPGVPPTHPLIVRSKRLNLPVWSELELGYRFCASRILAITGSDGKSTTCGLLAHTLRSAGFSVSLSGNIGTPISSIAADALPESLAVVEVSSYQLEHVETFSPWVAALLNLAPDHLARHRTMADYGSIKARIFAFQKPGSWRVRNGDNPELKRLVPQERDVQLLEFAQSRAVTSGAALVRSWLTQQPQSGPARKIIREAKLSLPGRHNTSNALAVLACVLPLDINPTRLAFALGSFQGLPHRLETLGHCQGILFVNDSKATNVHSATRALESFSRPIVLLAGGKDKGLSYSELGALIRQKVRLLVVFGEAAPRMETELSEATRIIRTVALDDAVAVAAEHALPKDVVLLSPACSSFDAYASFEERGEHFRELIEHLPEFEPVRRPVSHLDIKDETAAD